MKKLLLLAVMALAAASCQKKVENYYEAPRYTEKFTVSTGEWDKLDDGSAWFHNRTLPALDQDAVDKGLVAIYVGVEDGMQQPLPYTRYKYDENDDVIYAETIDFTFKRGVFTLFYTTSDFVYPHNGPLGRWDFRLVVYY